MSFKLLADHFSITRDSNHFIQLKTLKHPKVDDEVYLAFMVEGEGRFARATIQDLIDTFEDTFFDSPETKAYERFENALREVNLIYNNIKQKHGKESMGTVSGIVAVFSGTELHLTQCNQAEAYLIRKEKLSHISEGLASRGEDLFVNIASGEVLPEDKVVISTVRLLRYMSQNQLVNCCRNGVTEAIDAIREHMMEGDHSSVGVSCVHPQVPYRNRAGGQMISPSGFLAKWENLWKSIMSRLGEKQSEDATENELVMKEKDTVSRNTLLAAILAIVLILIVSVSFLVENRRNRELREEYTQKIETLNADINLAATKGHTDERESANVILDRAEKQAKEILESDFYHEEVLAILDKVNSTRDEINNTLRISNPAAYINLKDKNPAAKAVGITGLQENLFAFERDKIYKIIVDQPLEPKTLSENEVLNQGAAMEDLENLVFLTQSGRVVEYDGDKFEFINTQDESWKSGVDVSAFGRFFYILNPEQNQIYRYSRGNSNYSGASEYNIDGDLKEAVSLAIDGNVYVLKKGGEIVKLFRGEKQDFSVDALPVDISQANKIFTGPDLKHLYVLDSANKRVVVLEKEVGAGARYKGLVQLEMEGLDLKGLYVNKAETTVYLLGETAIYKVDLDELGL